MKKVALLCVAALFVAACHCEKKNTSTPCKKACKKAAVVQAPVAKKAPAQTIAQKMAEQSAALSAIGSVKQEGNKIALAYKEPIHFAHNSAVVDPVSYKELDTTANILKKYPTNLVTVKGYTDSLGNPAYNMELSQRRAQAVADELIARGVNPANIKAIGYGAENPIASNTTAEGRRLNRRVELAVSVK